MNQSTIFAMPPVSLSDSARNLENFRAELIEEGTYKHPTLGFTVQATKEKLTRWADVFKKMLAAGRQVTLPPGHEARFQPEKNFGHVEEITVEKKANGRHALFGKLVVPIADMAAKVGTTIKAVSIGIADKIADGFGQWEDCIDHVAFTNDPVATTAGNFQVALDAQAQIEWRILPLSAVAGADVHDTSGAALPGPAELNQNTRGTAPAPGLALEGKQVDLKKLRETLGLAEAVADEAVLTQACDAIASLRKTRDEATQKLSALATPAPKTEREKELEMKVLETRMESARDRADSDAVLVKTALEAGKFSARAADIVRKLLAVRTAATMNLSTGADEPLDIRQLAKELIAETREKAAVSIGEITKGLSLVSGGGGPTLDATRLTVDEVKKADIRALSALTGEEIIGLEAHVREAVYDRLSGKK